MIRDENGYVHKHTLIFKNQFHIIFCPKYRRKVLVNGIDKRLKEILIEISDQYGFDLKMMDVMPDHIHLFIEFDPTIALDKVVKKLKGISAHKLREEFPELVSKLPCLWTRSYFASSVGSISEDAVKKYIANQKNK